MSAKLKPSPWLPGITIKQVLTSLAVRVMLVSPRCLPPTARQSIQLHTTRRSQTMIEWSAEQTMHYLSISRATLYSLVKRGRLVKHRQAVGQGVGGRRTYFDAAEVKALKDTA